MDRPAPGYSSGQAIAAMEDLAKKLPQGFSYSWTGLSLEELQAGGTSLILFGLGTLVVYLTLSAQYESFVLPFIVLLAVPMALLGALGAQWMRGLQNDVFCQVGLVMLVGLASKNAILIVEFAEQLRERGLPLVEAAVQAATIRLRPILMTSLAFILGVVPLVVATGAGENGRHSVGTTVFGGMIMSTVLNLFFIPVLYLIIEGWREHGKGPEHRLGDMGRLEPHPFEPGAAGSGCSQTAPEGLVHPPMLAASSFFLLSCFAAAHFGHPFSGIHRAAAFGGSAVAGGGLFVVVEVVVPDEFFAGGDVAQGEEPDAAFDLIDLAVGIAGVIQVGAQALAVDHGLAVFQPI